jgi:hypothetical protein
MELVINDKSYYIPNKWSQVPLASYMRFMTTYNDDDKEVEKQIKLVSAFTGVPTKILGKAKYSIIEKSADRLTELIEQKPVEELALQLEIDGVNYGFHPKLKDLKLKEFVDLDNKLSDSWANMHGVMSILYRPIIEQKGDKYTIEEYDYVTANKRAEIFKNKMSMNIVSGAASFFLTIAVDYMSITQSYLKNTTRQKRRNFIRQMKKRLVNATAGIRSYII